MANYHKANLFDYLNEFDLVLFSANSVVKANGELVMGAGIAKQFKLRWPSLALDLGSQIVSLRFYGLVISNISFNETFKLGAFQSKYSFKDSSSIDLIKRSTEALQQYCSNSHPIQRIAMNMPGIGYGNLQFDEVKLITDELPNSVHIYYL